MLVGALIATAAGPGLRRAAAPEIGESAAREIAAASFGMVEAEVEAAARQHAATGTLPNSPYRPGAVPVNPNGQVMVALGTGSHGQGIETTMV